MTTIHHDWNNKIENWCENWYNNEVQNDTMDWYDEEVKQDNYRIKQICDYMTFLREEFLVDYDIWENERRKEIETIIHEAPQTTDYHKNAQKQLLNFDTLDKDTKLELYGADVQKYFSYKYCQRRV